STVAVLWTVTEPRRSKPPPLIFLSTSSTICWALVVINQGAWSHQNEIGDDGASSINSCKANIAQPHVVLYMTHGHLCLQDPQRTSPGARPFHHSNRPVVHCDFGELAPLTSEERPVRIVA